MGNKSDLRLIGECIFNIFLMIGILMLAYEAVMYFLDKG